SSVEVIDPVAREVVRRVDIGFRPTRLTHDTAADRIYVFGDDGVGVFGCGVDTIVTWLPVGFTNYSVCAPRHRRVYVSDWGDTRVWVIRDTTTVGIGEEGQKARPETRMQTLVRGALRLVSSRARTRQTAELVDITGRKVMDLKPGENDVRRLSPGVYFLRSAVGGKRSAVRKVIVNP
ncbi:MAG: T9SS type A sorting domain-containing protein, partial [candidate division WOR-3 bacterium]